MILTTLLAPHMHHFGASINSTLGFVVAIGLFAVCYFMFPNDSKKDSFEDS